MEPLNTYIQPSLLCIYTHVVQLHTCPYTVVNLLACCPNTHKNSPLKGQPLGANKRLMGLTQETIDKTSGIIREKFMSQ
jgi:hypothetical protein